MTPEEEAEAQQRLQEIIDTTAPKGLGQGLKSGVSNIVGGAIGGAGVAVLAPTLGLAAGLSAGGLVGGIVGLTGGALLGALGAAGLIVAGTSRRDEKKSRTESFTRFLGSPEPRPLTHPFSVLSVVSIFQGR
jgi:hypothetical protein